MDLVYPNITSDSYIGYFPAIFAVFLSILFFLSILTCIVSFVLVSDGFPESVTTIRCLKQIFMDLLQKHRLPRKPPWIQHEEEDLETRGRSMMSANQIFFKTYILIQYIWYKNICLKSWNASTKKQVKENWYFKWDKDFKLARSSLIVLVILFGIFQYCICIYTICLQSN